MKAKQIPCVLAQGFFDSEFFVSVGKSSAFVDCSALQVTDAPKADAEGHGLLTVFIVETRNDQTLIEIPGEPVVGGPRTWVPSALLEEKAVA